MRSRIMRAALMLAAAVLTGACAVSEEWAEWRAHTTHFASGQHGIFSVRNDKDGTNPRVTRADIEASRRENWWGRVITVSPGQIFEN